MTAQGWLQYKSINWGLLREINCRSRYTKKWRPTWDKIESRRYHIIQDIINSLSNICFLIYIRRPNWCWFFLWYEWYSSSYLVDFEWMNFYCLEKDVLYSEWGYIVFFLIHYSFCLVWFYVVKHGISSPSF